MEMKRVHAVCEIRGIEFRTVFVNSLEGNGGKLEIEFNRGHS